jgi:hypothetical protein
VFAVLCLCFDWFVGSGIPYVLGNSKIYPTNVVPVYHVIYICIGKSVTKESIGETTRANHIDEMDL